MASTSFMPSLSEMAEIRSNGLGVPILFLVGEDGLATVTVGNTRKIEKNQFASQLLTRDYIKIQQLAFRA